jgi:hypothetical protein
VRYVLVPPQAPKEYIPLADWSQSIPGNLALAFSPPCSAKLSRERWECCRRANQNYWDPNRVIELCEEIEQAKCGVSMCLAQILNLVDDEYAYMVVPAHGGHGNDHSVERWTAGDRIPLIVIGVQAEIDLRKKISAQTDQRTIVWAL